MIEGFFLGGSGAFFFVAYKQKEEDKQAPAEVVVIGLSDTGTTTATRLKCAVLSA